MSWQDYVDVHLVGTNCVVKAAICGLDGNYWAKSPDFNISPPEVQKIVAGFTNPDSLLANGIHLEGEKYITTAVEDYRIRGKKGAGGAHIFKTNSAVIISLYDEKIQPGQCANITEKLGEYLKSSGY